MKFKTYNQYLTELQKNSELAILPISATAELMEVSDNTIKNWIQKNTIEEIKISKNRYVKAHSIYSIINERYKKVIAVKERLIQLLQNDRRSIYYSEIMPEFGFNYKLSPDRATFGWILGEVSRLSYEEMEKDLGKGNGAFLSSIVWRKDWDFVGEGYWNLVYSITQEEPSSDEECYEYVEKHIQNCIEYYSNKN